MNLSEVVARTRGKAHRLMTSRFARRLAAVNLKTPVVSFTFDDAPRSAFRTGREILTAHAACATYYVSLGLLGADTEVGRIASREDVEDALADGCELGCHTFDHLDAQWTPLRDFVTSVARNAQALEQISPGACYNSFAYPKSGPTLAAKAAISDRFACCRGGRETINEGVVDLNLLNAIFLDRRTGADEAVIDEWVQRNAERRGWLIFATHDVAGDPSPHGCTPALLDYAAGRARDSGARLLPVAEACALLTPL